MSYKIDAVENLYDENICCPDICWHYKNDKRNHFRDLIKWSYIYFYCSYFTMDINSDCEQFGCQIKCRTLKKRERHFCGIVLQLYSFYFSPGSYTQT